jgi:hypothetical protein
MKRKLAGTTLFFVLGSAAFAQVWAPLFRFADGETAAVDVESIRKTAEGREAWMRRSLPKPEQDGTVQLMALHSYKCDERTEALMSVSRYRADGSVIRSVDFNRYEREYTASPPGSAGARLLAFVCSFPLGVDPLAIEGLELEP